MTEATILPHSLQVEQAVLGAMLLDGRTIDVLVDSVRPEDFYGSQHKEIYQEALACHRQGIEIDLVTLGAQLEKEGKLYDVGGLTYLADLSTAVATSSNIEGYIAQLKEKSLYRNLILLCHDVSRLCRSEEMTGNNVLDYLDSKLNHLSGHLKIGNPESVGAIIERMVTDLDKGIMSDESQGIKTGFADIDSYLTGMQRSDLIIIGGRPSMGKTSLVLKILTEISINQKRPVALFSLESSRIQILQRLLSMLGKIESRHFRKARIPDEFVGQFNHAVGLLGSAPFQIDDMSNPTVGQIKILARQLHRKHKIEVLAVDYLQLARPGERTNSENEAVGLIAQGLKALAKELNIVVIALSQLSRKSEGRATKRPELADLRESGEIEQVADVVMMVHRPEFYHLKTFDDGEDSYGKAEIRILKHRNGPTGDVKLTFLKEFTDFENYQKEER